MSAKTNAKKKEQDKPQSSGLGLDGLGDLAGLLNEQPAANAGGAGPQELPLDLIDEDPHQPRTADNPGFSPESIAEIGETIKARGVKSPISVRENPDAPGRYLINHGARRYRGSKWAHKTTIPAFIDNDYNEADQVIENLQRNELTAREIADFIGRELAKGKKKGEIAKEIGKSPAFVTQHVTLLDLPEPIAEAFNSGRGKDVTVINELVTAYKKNPDEVAAWLADDSQELTRGSVKLLREFLEDKRSHEDGDRDPNTVDALTGKTDAEAGDGEQGPQDDDAKGKKEPKEADPDKLKKAIIQVKHDDRPARLILNRRPPAEGWAWLSSTPLWSWLNPLHGAGASWPRQRRPAVKLCGCRSYSDARLDGCQSPKRPQLPPRPSACVVARTRSKPLLIWSDASTFYWPSSLALLSFCCEKYRPQPGCRPPLGRGAGFWRQAQRGRHSCRSAK